MSRLFSKDGKKVSFWEPEGTKGEGGLLRRIFGSLEWSRE